jgi:hypothetical protein
VTSESPFAGHSAFAWSDRASLQLALGGYYAALAVVYLRAVDPPAGSVIVAGALILCVLIAPLEYALGALTFSFLAAHSAELARWFVYLRWVNLAVAVGVLPLRFFLRWKPVNGTNTSKFGYLIALFLVLSAATLMTTVSIGLSVFKLGALVALFWIASGAAHHLAAVYGPAAPRRLAAGLLAFPLPLVVLSMVSYSLPGGMRMTGQDGRFIGYFLNANGCAAVLAMVAPLAAAPLFRRLQQPARGRLFLAGGMAVLFYFLLLATSRSSLLGVLAAVVVYSLVHADRKIAAAVLVVVVLISARILSEPSWLPSLAERYLYKYKGTTLLQSRIEPWKLARARFVKNPWMGLGFGVTSEAETGWTFGARTERSFETASSVWSALVQVGILGSVPLFLALLGVLFQAGRFGWKVKDPWFTGVYGLVLALSISALFEGWLITPGSFATSYFWVACFFLNALMCRFQPTRRFPLEHSASARQ